MVGVLGTLAKYIEENAGVKCLIEPQPVNLQEPHFRILAKGFSFEWVDETANYEASQFVAKLSLEGVLYAFGDGPDSFLDAVLKASFSLNLLFRKPFSVSFVDGSTGGFSVSLKSKTDGVFTNSSEGSQPFLYKEVFEMELFMPYAVLKGGEK